jgi:serine/threonine-protein kinase
LSQDIERAATQIEAWLTTMHAGESELNQDRTLMPKPGTQQPLMKSFAKKGPGSSAAPLELGSILAEGGMGVVKLAKQKALGRTVVVKTMRGDYELSAAEDILREAWATGALEHPNIVPVHDVRVGDDGTPVIVLKRIEGDSWTTLMHDEELLAERFGVRDVLDWNLNVLSQVCQAVRFAHSRDILHRDLKPDNVMVGAFGEVYLVDWGIALSLSGDSKDCPLSSAKDQSSMAGTPCYMAPEMLGSAPLDVRTDTYLLGGLLFEILAQRPPHRTTSLADIMEDIRTSNPDIPESAPPLLADMVRRSMAASPDERFPSADDFADALQLFQQTRGSQLLAEEADDRLEQLEALLKAEKPDPQEVHRLFGAIRFGYETAIDAWEENDSALHRLDDARILMVEYELKQGHATAAQGLYQEIHDAPKELGDRITEAIASRHEEQEELARFRDNSDWRLGLKTRLGLITMLGFVWTAMPLARHFDQSMWISLSYRNWYLLTLALALLAVGAWFWARDSMSKTDLNRRLSATLLSLFPTQLVLYAGANMMDMTIIRAEILMIFLWGVLLSAATATIDKRFFVSALTYGAAFLFAIKNPELRYIAMAVSNGALVATGLYIWPRERKAETQ